MTGPIEPADDPELDEMIGHVLRAKADRAATAAEPFEQVRATGVTRTASVRRRLLALGAVVIVVVVALAGIGLSGLLPVASIASPTPSATGTTALRRPFKVPVLAADGACPVTPVGLTLASLGTFQGSGPVRVNNLDEVPINELPFQDGWYGQKVFWAIDARESGPILVRVARIDGTGGIGLGTDNSTELMLSNTFGGDTVVGPAPSSPITRIFIDGVSFREPGCYFMQMDGPTTTSTVVFRALNIQAGPSTLPASAPPSLLPGGISREAAIAIAKQHIPLAVFVSAEAGRFGDLNSNPSIRLTIKADRIVWAITFEGDITVCAPPPVASCESPVPGVSTAFLDYYTGEFLLGGGGTK